ncbi:hypothetical protein WR25_14062 [Diploscapter pachys]|uniref:Uncharacterized protein n=1 Tax=Diploscapter pachys TaxID=2018661 RepID=A0A2A2J643_9BILA|nr:hypothetical protein WR25_14062 [Diploscapter pachys]
MPLPGSRLNAFSFNSNNVSYSPSSESSGSSTSTNSYPSEVVRFRKNGATFYPAALNSLSLNRHDPHSIYENVPDGQTNQGIYQNLAAYQTETLNRRRSASQVQRPDSSLKRRIIARTQSERRNEPVTSSNESLAAQFTKNGTTNDQKSMEGPRDLLMNLDYEKLEAVLKFMQENNIDPWENNRTKDKGKMRRNDWSQFTQSLDRKQLAMRGNNSAAVVMNSKGETMSAGARCRQAHLHGMLPPDGRRLRHIEYGPGIVEKLKAKFHRLSGIVTKEAKVSPHTTGKRCPSMDDILASGPKEFDEEPVHPFSPRALLSPTKTSAISPLSRKHSKSTSDVYGDEESRAFSVHRTVHLEKEDVDASSISALRRKFEANVQRRPSQNMRHAKEEEMRYKFRPVPIDLDQITRPKSDSLSTLPSEQKRDPFESSAPQQHVQHVPQQQSYSQTSLRRVTMLPDEHISDTSAALTAAGNDNNIARMTVVYSNLSASNGYSSVPPPLPPHATHPSTTAPPLKVFEARRDRASSIEPVPTKTTHDTLNRYVTSGQEEPEFVKIGRRLRRSEPVGTRERSSSLGRTTDENKFPVATNRKVTSPTEEIKRLLIPRKNVELPTLSSNARIIRQEPDLVSPPDPDSARIRSPAPVIPLSDTLTVETAKTSDYSPPPEEPKPPQDLALPSSYFINRPTGMPPLTNSNTSTFEMTNNMTQYSRSAGNDSAAADTNEPILLSPTLTTPKILPKVNDESGRNEMYRLLDRFQKTRPRDDLEDLEKKPLETKRFIPTVVGVRQTGDQHQSQTLSTSSSAHSTYSNHSTHSTAPLPESSSNSRVLLNSTPQPRPNVVSISVRPQGKLLYSNVGRG